MKKFTPIIRVTCLIMCFTILTGILASCKKGIDEPAVNTSEESSEVIIEETAEETSEETTEETTESTTASTTKRPSTYKDDVDENFPYTLCSYTTNYKTSQKDRSTNLAVASRKINDLVLPSGAMFSFNGVVGKRTKESGFKEAVVFNNGEEDRGMGGGVCQVSSTVFQAALRSNFTIVERHYHSRKVGYVPLGCDATVYYGSQDFRFINNHPCAIKIKVYCSGGKLTCKILAEKNVDFGNIRVKVTGTEKSCKLVRYCNGEQNYSTSSYYKNGGNNSVNVNIENKPNENATTAPPTTAAPATTQSTTAAPPTTKPTTAPTTAPTTKPTQPTTEPSTEPTTEPTEPSTDDTSESSSQDSSNANE